MEAPKALRTAIYARVSKDTGEQNPDNQLVPLREFAASQKWTIVREYVDLMTGSEAKRPKFQAMMEAAAKREFDVVLFWSLDRFSRLAMVETLIHLKKLADHGVKYRSLQEPYLDTTNPFGDVIVAFVAKIAEMERLRIKDRVTAGLRNAVANGKRLGRPPAVFDRQKVRELRAKGMSIRKIAEVTGVKRTSVAEACK
jgi:DNA invertase Pin-like site-specific DNA recombinase